MAIELTREVLDHAPPELTAAERLVLLAIAEFARSPSRGWCGPQSYIAARAGLSLDGTRRAFGRLENHGLEVRQSFGRDRRGEHIYAVPGRSPRFAVPQLAPPDCDCWSCTEPGGWRHGVARRAVDASSGSTQGGTDGTPSLDKAGPAAHLVGGTSGTPSNTEGGTRRRADGTSGTARRDETPTSPARRAGLHRPEVLVSGVARPREGAPPNHLPSSDIDDQDPTCTERPTWPPQPCGRRHDPSTPCGGCAAARKAAEQQTADAEDAEAAERAEIARQRRACRLCDENGLIENPQTGVLRRCRHASEPSGQRAPVDRLDPLAYSCPTCDVPPGHTCNKKGGSKKQPHQERIDLAQEQAA